MKSLQSFLKHGQNWIALIIIGVFFFVALAAPLLAPSNTENPITGFKFANDPKGYLPHPPSPGAPLGSVPTGTPNRQIDVFYTIVWGTRSALQFGLTVALAATIFGVIIGALSAYMGGTANNIIMRTTDAFLAFPVIVSVVFIQQLYLLSVSASGGSLINGEFMDPVTHPIPLLTLLENVDPVMVAIILFSWMISARLTNTVVLRVKQAEYIAASKALGASHARILFRHLIPNSLQQFEM
jgi:ABC-type dipeptide/oligopeptide/nickel transport system permease subunit